MRKTFKAALPILAMAVGISLLASSAKASFWLKGMGFYYSPDYGSLGDSLDKATPYETPERLEAGTGTSLSVGYEFSERWGVRLDTFSFTGAADYHHLVHADRFYFETSTSPILLSIVYRIPREGGSHHYFGAGIGSFPSKLRIRANIPGRELEETDSPVGFQLLAGLERKIENGLFLSGEVRYISAKAEYSGYRCIKSCSTDWSGIFASIGLGYRF